MNIPLNIDWQQILLHFFNFSILVGGLYLLLFKPVKRFMEKREKHYADMEAAAVAREKDTEALKAAMAQREADFDAVLEEKRAAAAKEAEAFAQQQRDAAKAQADNAKLTDDCSAVERLGFSVKIVEGDERNLKVTTPLDLKIAELLLEETK